MLVSTDCGLVHVVYKTASGGDINYDNIYISYRWGCWNITFVCFSLREKRELLPLQLHRFSVGPAPRLFH